MWNVAGKMARASSRKRSTVNYNESPATKAEAATPSSTIKDADRVEEADSKAVVKAEPSAVEKRKAEPDASETDSGEASRAAKRPKAKAKAKAKTKAKGDDGMLLAERTAVASLGKAMYIGAHVSAAGGTLCLLLGTPLRVNRLGHVRCAHATVS